MLSLPDGFPRSNFFFLAYALRFHFRLPTSGFRLPTSYLGSSRITELLRCAPTDEKVKNSSNPDCRASLFHIFSLPLLPSPIMPSPSAHRRSPIPEHRVSRQSSSSNGSEIIGSLSGYHRSGSPLLAQGYNDVPWETYEAEVEKVVNLIGNSDISDDWAGSVLRPFEAEWEHQDGRTRAILLERIRHTVARLEAVPGERRHREDYCFSGAIPPFEQLISGGLLRHAGSGTVDVPQKSFFHVATAQYVVAQALYMLDHPHSQASSNELNSPELEVHEHETTSIDPKYLSRRSQHGSNGCFGGKDRPELILPMDGKI
ncbi:hypothetical protein JCM5353_001918 [Sporobolomyces roseus]